MPVPAETLTAAEIAKITGKQRAASQAAVLAKLGIPFAFSGRSVTVQRLIAQAHELLPEQRPAGGVDLSKVR
jgi:hypothetical protein